MDFAERYGSWACIAGASMGIGRAFSMEVAAALFDQLADGPVCFSRPADAVIARGSLNLPRDEVTRIWREAQETSTRLPDRQAL